MSDGTEKNKKLPSIAGCKAVSPTPRVASGNRVAPFILRDCFSGYREVTYSMGSVGNDAREATQGVRWTTDPSGRECFIPSYIIY